MATNIAYPVPAAIHNRHGAIADGVANHAGEPALSAARLPLVAALFLGTLAFGAVQAWAWGVTAVLVALALFLWTLATVRSGVLRVVWTPIYLPAAAFFLLGFVQFSAHLTADPISTRESFVKLATDLVIFFLATQLWSVESPEQNRRLVIGIVIFAGALALFSLSQFFASPGTIYGIVKPRWGGWIFGPYVNHNHYAGLMEMLIPIALCYLFFLGTGRGSPPGRALAAFAVVVAVASLLLSGSRGGLLSLAAELLLLTLILWRRRPGARRSRLAAAGLLGMVAVALLFLWMDSGQISKRLGTIADVTRAPDATLGERRMLARDSLRIFHDHPWLGTGLGSFATVYPRYRSFASDLEWDHAHNDYAEALAETGIAGAVVILSALGLFFILAFRNLNERLEHGSGWIGLGAAIGCCGLMVHGLADFNLHIPANAAWFSLLIGLAVSPAGLRRTPEWEPG
jgi:O-antigen ligase